MAEHHVLGELFSFYCLGVHRTMDVFLVLFGFEVRDGIPQLDSANPLRAGAVVLVFFFCTSFGVAIQSRNATRVRGFVLVFIPSRRFFACFFT